MSGVLGTRAYQNYFDNPVSYAQGGITASMPAGSLVGSLSSSFLADKYSRKFALQVASILWVIGSIIQCAAVNRGMLCAGRVIGGKCVKFCFLLVGLLSFLFFPLFPSSSSRNSKIEVQLADQSFGFWTGLSIGIASSIVPVYQSEIAPKHIRGRVVSLQQWAITWGILIQYFIQYGASNVSLSHPMSFTLPSQILRETYAHNATPTRSAAVPTIQTSQHQPSASRGVYKCSPP